MFIKVVVWGVKCDVKEKLDMIKVFQFFCEWGVDPYSHIIGWMHFRIVKNHKNNFLAVYNAESCLGICVPDFCKPPTSSINFLVKLPVCVRIFIK